MVDMLERAPRTASAVALALQGGGLNTEKNATRRWRPLSAITAAGIALAGAMGLGAPAQPASEASIAAGRRIYHQKADCQSCHGWAGDGNKMDFQSPDGANLRTSQLDRDQLVFVITCGLPGREMPAFDRRAYTDDRCLGRTRADLDRMGLSLPDPAATLQQREIERLADFLLTKVVGQGEMDRAKCVDFWGEDVAICSDLP